MNAFIISLLVILCLNTSCKTKNQFEENALCQSSVTNLRQCPKGLNNIFLPRTYSPNILFVGYSSDSNHFSFIQKLIDILEKTKNPPEINVLVPREDIADAQRLFKSYYHHPLSKKIHIYPSISDETMWMQDYFELLTDTRSGIAKIIDLPYTDREGELIPASLSLTCKSELVEGPIFENSDQVPGNGDYGGNIEPFSEKILVIGNTMTDKLQLHLKKLTSQELIEVNVSWLDTGHVDELFAMLPHKKDATPCEQTIVYSSPKKAFELLESQVQEQIPVLPTFSFEEIQENYPDYSKCLKNMQSIECKNFYTANQTYQKIIENDLQLISDSFMKHHGCKLTALAFPQLFTPLKIEGIFGTIDDRSVAFNQNSVNNIYFWPNLIMPKQTIPVFHHYIEKQLERFPYKVFYSNADFVHTLLGGIHCATNVSYACQP